MLHHAAAVITFPRRGTTEILINYTAAAPYDRKIVARLGGILQETAQFLFVFGSNRWPVTNKTISVFQCNS